jgi:hypothetical protein
MRKRKRTQVTVETNDVLVIRRATGRPLGACPVCGARGSLATVAEAARVSRVSERTIHRWVEDARVHFTETPAGQLLVCARSLPAGNTQAGSSRSSVP